MTRHKLSEAQQVFLKTGSLETAPNEVSLSESKLSISQLITWKEQPRKYFPPEHLQQLADSIRRRGLDYPLTVRPAGDKYEVIVGECRLQACRLAPLDPVPVKILPLDDQQALELALSENLDRQDLNSIEVLDSLLKLLGSRLHLEEKQIRSLLYEMKRAWETQPKRAEVVAGDINIPSPENEQQQIVCQTFKQYGYHWYSYICNQLKLRDLPEDLYEAISQGKIEYSKGLRFKSVKNDALRHELLEQAIAEGWTQREIQQRIKDKLSQEASAKEGDLPNFTPQSRLYNLTNRLKKIKLWQSHPKAWKKIETRLDYIENLLVELEPEKDRQEKQEASLDSELA